MLNYRRIIAVILIFASFLSLCRIVAVSGQAEAVTVPDGYSLSVSLGDEGSKFMSSDRVLHISNWSEGIKGLTYRDNWSTQRTAAGDAEIIIEVSSHDAVEVGTVISSAKQSVTYNRFYTSSDGVLWNEIYAAEEIRDFNSELPEGYKGLVSSSYIFKRELILDLPQGISQLKIVTGTTESMSWQPGIDYIDIYTKDMFSSCFEGYTYVDTLLTADRTLSDKAVVSSLNWTFGVKGLPFRDTYGTQRANSDNSDAGIVLAVSDCTAIEVATVIADSLSSVTSNTYRYSFDGVEWFGLDENFIFSKKEYQNENNLLSTGYFALIERVICPEQAKYIEIITSTQNAANTWWQPSVNYIDFYRLDSRAALVGRGFSGTILDGVNGIDNHYVTYYCNWSYGKLGVGGRDGYSTQLAQGEYTASMIFSVKEANAFSVGTLLPETLAGSGIHTFYSSENGYEWESMAEICVLNEIYSADMTRFLSEGQTLLCQTASIPENVQYIKIETAVAQGNWWEIGIDYIDLYCDYATECDMSDKMLVEEITFSSSENGLEHVRVASSYNLQSGIYTPKVNDGSTASRASDTEAQLVLCATDNEAISVTYALDGCLVGSLDARYFYSCDLLSWYSVPAEYIVRKSVFYSTATVCDTIFSLPENTQYVKCVVSSCDVPVSYQKMGFDTVEIYSTVYDIMSASQKITVSDGVITVNLDDGVMTADMLTEQLSLLNSDALIYYYDTFGNEVFNGSTVIENGFTATICEKNKMRRQYTVNTVNSPVAQNAGFDLKEVFSVTRVGSLITLEGSIPDGFRSDPNVKYYVSQNNVGWTRIDLGSVQSIGLMNNVKYLKITGNSIFSTLAQQGIDCITFGQSSGNVSLVSPTNSSFIGKGGKYITSYIPMADCSVESLVIAMPSQTATAKISFYTASDDSQAEARYDSGTKAFVLRGDANGDTELNIIDLIRTKKTLAQKASPNDFKAADTDCNGSIDALDLSFIRKALLGG